MALIHKLVVFHLLLCAICVRTETSSEETDVVIPFESSRALKDDFMDNKWKAVDPIPLDTSGWIPEPNPLEQFPQDQEAPKRRRIRKRKRRPQIVSLTQTEEEKILPKRRRPQLEEQQSWNEMVQEGRITPYKRRRVFPTYQPIHEKEKDFIKEEKDFQNEDKIFQNEGKIFQNEGKIFQNEEKDSQKGKIFQNEGKIIQKEVKNFQNEENNFQKEKIFQNEQTQTEKGTITIEEETLNLKTLIKQAGSLSEILQRRNLTLSDLLKGEKKAIYALTEKTITNENVEYKNPIEESEEKNQREEIEIITKQPEIIKEIKVQTSFINKQNNLQHNFQNNLKNNLQNNFQNNFQSNFQNNFQNNPQNNPQNNLQNNRQNNPQNNRQNNSQNNLKYNLNTEKPKLGNIIVINYKPNVNEFGNDFYQSTTSEESSTKSQIKTQNIRLPVTNAKLNRYSTPRIITKTQPTKTEIKTEIKPEIKNPETPKPYNIPISEVLNILMATSKENKEAKKQDEPLRMSIDLNKVLEEKHKLDEVTEAIKTIKLLRTTELIRTTERIPEKIKAITAKDEIFEILKDLKTKENLTKILNNRNMTIDDLVELRERGSSQKHLADLFHNKTKEPEAEKKVYIGQFLNIKPTERMGKSKRPIEDITTQKNNFKILEENLEENQDKNKYTITSFPTYKIEMDKKYKEVISEPKWKDFDKLYHSTHQKGTVENLDEFENKFEDISLDDEITSNSISEKGNEKLNIDEHEKFQDEDGNVFIKLPYGVKHAILASLLIIGVSLFIFVTILVIFKWSQKHKRRLCYSGSFSCSKFNSILEDGEKRTFRTFVSETLGRKKHFYKQHLQSMSDTWENDKKPFQ